MWAVSTRSGFRLWCAAALLCAAGLAGLLLPAAPAAQGPAALRGVRMVQHGSYPELQVDGKPFFINSAEFFYPRVPRNLWDLSLERYRDLGINTISLSIPWNWHEPREGEIDFDGHTNPRRDLRALLKLVADKGFKLIARPGPVAPGAWRNGGYPDWLLERPEYRMPFGDRLEGREPPAAELAAVDAEAAARMWLENSTHMEFSRKWLEAVARELAPYRALPAVPLPPPGENSGTASGARETASGPLLFVQVEEGWGSGRANTAGSAFWKYVDGLCSVLFESGSQAQCVIDPAQLRPFGSGSELSAKRAVMGQWFPSARNERGAEEERISAADVAEFELVAGSLGTHPAFPPILAAFNAVSFAPGDDARPQPSAPENLRTSSHLLIGYGVRGLNWFPVQDSLTPAGFGTPEANRFYRWDAALALNGSKQPAAREVQRLGDWLRSWGSQLAASHRRADFGLVDTLGALQMEKPARVDVAAMTSTTVQLERLAQYAGMSAELVDPERQPQEQLLRHALLLLPVYKPEDATYALTAEAQRTLDAYVRAGGVLVCFPGRPVGDVFDVMARGQTVETGDLPAGTTSWRVGSGRLVVLTKDFYSWVSIREDFADGNRRFEAPFARALLEALMKTAALRQIVRREGVKAGSPEVVISELVSNEGTLPLGGRSGGQAWLSVVNLGDATVSEMVQVLSPRASARLEKAGADDWIEVPVKLPPRESLLLPIDVVLCLEPELRLDCQDRLSTSGAELVRAEREGKSMFLTFYAPAKVEVRVHLGVKPQHFEVDEAQADAKWLKEKGELVVELLRGASPHFLHVLRVPLPYAPALRERPKADSRKPSPAHFRFSPAGAVRLPLGEDAALLTNPPLFVFRRGEEGSFWMVADNLGEQGGSVQVQATGQFNTSAKAYVNGKEIRSLNLRLPVATVEKAAGEAPAADGLYHGSLHFAAGAESLDLPVSYAILPEKEAAAYQFDFDGDGSAERVLENAAVRAIVSPAEGGRIVALVAKSSDRDMASSMGLLEDAFAFTPNPRGIPRERARGSAGTFNRAYSAAWIQGAGGPALDLRYDAPDVYPHGARIEKTARFKGERTLAVEYHVALLPADARRIQDEEAGKIFATPPPVESHPQSFVILNSVPAIASGLKHTQFCWKEAAAGTNAPAGSEHCESFVPGGAAISPPAGVRQIDIREARRPGLALAWEDEGARLTLEPKNYSVLLRLEFPPLDPGGAVRTYRIEFSVKEAP